MRLERFIAENFLTYSHIDYTIPNRPLLIQGRNLTEEDQASNGSGKSGIFTGIEFCITASNSRDVRDLELVTYGHKSAKVQLFASCDIRKERIHISWDINIKGSNQLILMKQDYEGEWSAVSFSNVNDGKKYILSWFAISKEDLFNYFIINKTRFKSFFKASNREKVDLINRFSDASIIDGIDEVDNKELYQKYENLKVEANKLEGRIEDSEEEIRKEKSRDFKKELESMISSKNRDIEDLKEDIQSAEFSIIKAKKEKEQLSENIKNNIRLADLLKKEEPSLLNKLSVEEGIVTDIETKIIEAKSLVDNFSSTNWDGVRNKDEEILKIKKNQLLSTRSEENKEREQEKKILSFLQSINIQLENSITCPKCSHEFVLDGDIDILNQKKTQANKLKLLLEEKRINTKKLYSSIEGSIAEINKSLSLINDKEIEEGRDKNNLQQQVNLITSQLNSQKNKIRDIGNELRSIDNRSNKYLDKNKDIELEKKSIDKDISLSNREIESCKNQIEKIEESKKLLKIPNNANEIKRLCKKVEDYRESKDDLNKELLSLGDEIFKRNQWGNNFKQFKMFIANQSLETIEFHCNRYLAGMSSDMKVKLEGFKILASGLLKDEITAKIIRNTERTFSSFSGGEQGRLLFAGILANRHMINQTHKYGGLDFLCIDEVFEGVDGLGLKYLLKSAKELSVAAMIITHVTSEHVNEDYLTIVKENGISRIEQVI